MKDKEIFERKKSNICVIRRGFFPQDPRVNKEVRTLVEYGFNVDVVCLKKRNQSLKEKSEPSNIYRIPAPHIKRGIVKYTFEYLYFFIAAFIVVNILNLRKRYKYIQANSIPNFLIFTAIIPKLLGARIILDIHEPMPELFSSLYRGVLAKMIFKILILEEKISFVISDKIITVSEPLKSLFISRNKFVSSKIVVIHNTPYIKTPNKHFIKKNTKGLFKIISQGTILKRYGFKTLIETVPYLDNLIPQYKIIIIGDGEFLPDLINYVKKNGWEDRVEFKGFLPQEKLFEESRKCDVGVVPIEGDNFTQYILPNKLFEFAEIGIPIISSYLKTIKMYFGDTILYFKPGKPEDLAERIILLYNNYTIGVQSSQRVKRIIAMYTWKIEKEKYYNLFR